MAALVSLASLPKGTALTFKFSGQKLGVRRAGGTPEYTEIWLDYPYYQFYGHPSFAGHTPKYDVENRSGELIILDECYQASWRSDPQFMSRYMNVLKAPPGSNPGEKTGWARMMVEGRDIYQVHFRTDTPSVFFHCSERCLQLIASGHCVCTSIDLFNFGCRCNKSKP